MLLVVMPWLLLLMLSPLKESRLLLAVEEMGMANDLVLENDDPAIAMSGEEVLDVDWVLLVALGDVWREEASPMKELPRDPGAGTGTGTGAGAGGSPTKELPREEDRNGGAS